MTNQEYNITDIDSSVRRYNELPIRTTIRDISKYGNIELEYPATKLLSGGFTYGDTIAVTFMGKEYIMPIGTNYADVNTNELICRLEISELSGDDNIVIGINLGDLATSSGIATKQITEEEPGYIWEYHSRFTESPEIELTMDEPGGYLDQYSMKKLVVTNTRTDYSNLSDEEFANFREIKTTGTAAGRLFRSSSPVNPILGRCSFADTAMRESGIRTVINLTDSTDEMNSYPDFPTSYYSSCNIIPLCLGVDFTSPDFRHGLAKGLRFLADNEGPYLIHCTEGKDRCGFTSALIECLMGATIKEVTDDYMKTYDNYYGVNKTSSAYNEITESNVLKFLSDAFETPGMISEDTSLADEAYEYMHDTLGLTDDEISALKKCIGE